MNSNVRMTKQWLRKAMLNKRQALNATQRAQCAVSAAQHFAEHPLLAFDDPVALYVAIRGELDVLPIATWLSRYNKIACLPYSHKETGKLSFHGYGDDTLLEPDEAGVMAPMPSTEALSPKIILVPLLAFDSSGARLGYGGGYYDKTLADLRNQALADAHAAPLAVGVGYNIQELPPGEIPLEVHDMKLDAILTEQGVSMFDKSYG